MPSTKLQQSLDFSGQKFHVGLDVHKASWTVTVRTLNLEVEHFHQPPSAKSLVSHLKQRFPAGEFLSAYEAGFCGSWIHTQLLELGVTNILVSPADIPATDKDKKNKTDLHDSRSIARNLEKGNLRGIYVHSREQQQLRALFRLRDGKTRDVTRAINRLKSFLYYFGMDHLTDLPLAESVGMTSRMISQISKLKMGTEAGDITLKSYIDNLLCQRMQLLEITRQLKLQVLKQYSIAYSCLLSIPGIGSITAMGLLAEIGDFDRFDDPDQFCSFLGLMPWQDSSGETFRTKGLQPRCNTFLRPLLIEASWQAIRKSPELLVYYRKHAVKNNKHAIVKVTRKLALIARSVVQRKQKYQPGYGQSLIPKRTKALKKIRV